MLARNADVRRAPSRCRVNAEFRKRNFLGSRHFVADDENIDVSRHQAQIARLYGEGERLRYIGYGETLVGLLAIKEQLRENSAETVRRLRQLGVKRILMLTGDHRTRTAALRPIAAATLHNGSTIAIVLNALLARKTAD